MRNSINKNKGYCLNEGCTQAINNDPGCTGVTNQGGQVIAIRKENYSRNRECSCRFGDHRRRMLVGTPYSVRKFNPFCVRRRSLFGRVGDYQCWYSGQ